MFFFDLAFGQKPVGSVLGRSWHYNHATQRNRGTVLCEQKGYGEFLTWI